MQNLSILAKSVAMTMVKHSPAILSGLAAGGVVATAIMAVRATPEATRRLEALDLEAEGEAPVLIQDKIFAVWDLYLPAAGFGTLTITAILLSSRIQSKRLAMAVSAYSMAEAALHEFQDAVLETTDEKTLESVRDLVSQKTIESRPLGETNVIHTGSGETLCYDPWSARYFYSSHEELCRAQNKVNHRLINDVWVTLNELYSEIGLEHTRAGETFGWSPERLIDIRFRTMLAEERVPCIILDYVYDPTLNKYI